MRKNTLQNINHKRKDRKSKKLALLTLSCILMVSVTGCIYKSKGEYLGKIAKSEDEQSDAMMQSIIDALEAQDAEALKDLFSPYALEEAEDLDDKIEELMEFYPGCDGDVDGDCVSRRGNEYGDIVLTLEGMYTFLNHEQTYLVSFIMQPRNDEEPDKIGLYLIEMLVKDTAPKGFKLKSMEAEPGIYVHE